MLTFSSFGRVFGPSLEYYVLPAAHVQFYPSWTRTHLWSQEELEYTDGGRLGKTYLLCSPWGTIVHVGCRPSGMAGLGLPTFIPCLDPLQGEISRGGIPGRLTPLPGLPWLQ